MSAYMNIDDCSRDELLKYCKEMQTSMLSVLNNPPVSPCPFCYGSSVVSKMKCQMKDNLISEWHKSITQEEYEAWGTQYMEKLKGNQCPDTAKNEAI